MIQNKHVSTNLHLHLPIGSWDRYIYLNLIFMVNVDINIPYMDRMG